MWAKPGFIPFSDYLLSLFLGPSLPQSPPPPSLPLGSRLIPLLASHPWYSHYIPSGYFQSLWNVDGIPGITGGWLAGWLVLGIGNMFPSSWGKQQRKLLSCFFLHLHLAFFITEMKMLLSNDWTERRLKHWFFLHIRIPLLSLLLLSGLRNKNGIANVRGINFFSFWYCSQEWSVIQSIAIHFFLLPNLKFGKCYLQ